MDQLESFKTNINLAEFSASCGYEWDRRESSINSVVMRHPDGDKIIIARRENGHYVYFSVRDDHDNGTIIDFLQKRQGLSLGYVRQELRPWIGQGERPRSLRPLVYPKKIKTASKDIAGVITSYQKMKMPAIAPYLLERGIPEATIKDARFQSRMRIDARGNIIFPHFNKGGMCGYEIKNKGFTGFSKGGEKGLWLSGIINPKDVKILVFCESAIDALSIHALADWEAVRYASIGGKPNPLQPDLITLATKHMPQGGRIISAMDADVGGRSLADMVEQAVMSANRPDIDFEIIEPPEEDTDWNDQLQAKNAGRPVSFPIARSSFLSEMNLKGG